MVDVHVHTTDQVGTNKRDTAKNALEKMDDDLDNNYVVYNGANNLDNSKNPGLTSKYDWLSYVEDELHSLGYLGSSNLHVVLYSYCCGGAGFAQFNWQADDNDGGFWGVKGWRSYESQDGKYGIASVNIQTSQSPYNNEWYENTVIQEAAHLFDVQHYHGAIRVNCCGDYYASPMVTWYVEQGCLATTDNSKPINDLCVDESGSKDACFHWQQISNCTGNESDSWINTYS